MNRQFRNFWIRSLRFSISRSFSHCKLWTHRVTNRKKLEIAGLKCNKILKIDFCFFLVQKLWGFPTGKTPFDLNSFRACLFQEWITMEPKILHFQWQFFIGIRPIAEYVQCTLYIPGRYFAKRSLGSKLALCNHNKRSCSRTVFWSNFDLSVLNQNRLNFKIKF